MPTINTSMPASSRSPPATPSASKSPATTPTGSSRRKRSSPTASSKDTLHSCSSNSALVYPVPASVSWLEQLTLSVALDSHSKAGAHYVLTVHHAKSKSSWHHARSFDDYRHFQKRLQRALRHGHFCHAECPWLFTFVKSYFPPTCMLGHVIARKRVMEKRREILERCLVTLQTFLSKRGNHCCSVLTSTVADEVVAFINGDEGAIYQACHGITVLSSPSSAHAMIHHHRHQSGSDTGSTSHRKSWGSISNSNSDANESSVEVVDEQGGDQISDNTEDDDSVCRICHSHLAQEAYSPRNNLLQKPPMVPNAAVVDETVLPPSPSDSGRSTGASSDDTDASPPLSPAPVPAPVLSRKASSKTRVTAFTTATTATMAATRHFYTTRLACGHQFHDECIVPKLNESMHCPTCGRAETRS